MSDPQRIFDFTPPPKASRQGFEDYHAENPQVFALFCAFTLQAVEAGRSRFGAFAVINRIRWYTTVDTQDSSGLKINNNWAPFYARLFEEQYPQHEGLFEKRKAIADKGAA